MTKAEQYCYDVLSGKIITGSWIKLVCQRFLDDINNPKWHIDYKKLDLFNRLCSLLHYYTDTSKKPIELEPWQQLFVTALFCLYDDEGNRKYNEGYLSVARKNSKTTTCAIIGLFALLCDGVLGNEIYLAANSKDQSKILLNMCQIYAKQLDPSGKDIKIYHSEIKVGKTNSLLKNVSADTSKLDGANLGCFVIDEWHEAVDSKMYDVLKSSQGFRKNPLAIMITTAGLNKNCFCKEMEDYYKEVLSGTKTDDKVFPMIYQLDEGDEWTDVDNLIKCNPNLGVSVRKEFLLGEINKARQNPVLEPSVRVKYVNQWQSSSIVWISEDNIKRCLKPVDMSDFIGKNNWLCYGGFDLASVSDLTALTFLFIDPDEEKYVFKTFYFLPKTALDGKFNSELYKYWASKGYLILTDSPTTDFNYVQNQIQYWYENLPIELISYDAWNSSQLVNNLISNGIPMKAYSQSIGNFNKPTREVERLILSGKVIIDNNPITRFCFDNVELKLDINGNAKPMGNHQDKKIDGVISMLNALGGYLTTLYDSGEAFVIPFQNS